MEKYWEEIYHNEKTAEYDGWLNQFLPLFSEGKVLDLGCGNGGVSDFLVKQGFEVLACDFSDEALKNVKYLNPQVKTQKVDLSLSLPFAEYSVATVIAQLSLHYFSSDLTQQILHEIWRILRSDGLLIACVNSAKDIHFGAGQGEEIERNFYLKNGNMKRFFDEKMVQQFFLTEKWEKLSIREQTKSRFGQEKTFWEIVLRKQENK